MKDANQLKFQKSQFYFLLILLFGTIILSYYVLRPFLTALVLAVVFTVVFQPVHRYILKYTRNHESLAAFLTTVVIVVTIFTPLTFLAIKIFQESRDLYVSLIEGNGRENFVSLISGLLDNFRAYFLLPEEFSINLSQYLKDGLSWLLNNLGALFSNFVSILTAAFVFLISLYYLLKDGQKLKRAAIEYSPLANIDDEMILSKLELAIGSVIKGNFTIAFLQGILSAVGFSIFGVPNALLWGVIAAFAALVPSVGTSLVFIPVVALMFFSGQIFSAVGLIFWGALAVGLIDNLLAPKLIGRGMKLHPLIILFSVLGGLVFFGPVGFILGPIVLSLLFALLHIYFYITNNGDKGEVE